LSGQAVQQAAFALRDKLIQLAAALFGCSLHAVRLERGAAVGPKRSKLKFADLAARAKSMDESLTARGSIDIKERLGAMCFFAEAAEVRVDPETGQVKVRKMISAHDIGTIINPLTHRGQVEGGMIQGFGFAMSEDLAAEDGKIVTANLGEYKKRAQTTGAKRHQISGEQHQSGRCHAADACLSGSGPSDHARGGSMGGRRGRLSLGGIGKDERRVTFCGTSWKDRSPVCPWTPD
jgi:xanthine dehydrogenase molybdopterin-binding subunit B